MAHSLPFPPHSGHPLHVIATSIAELDCITELIHPYSEFCHYTQTFFFFFQPYQSHSQADPMPTQTLALDKGCFSHLPHLKHYLKHMAVFCLNTLDLIFLFTLHF